MSIYTVHVPAADLDRPLAVSRAVFVREGFNWGAFFFAPLWCIFRRSWLGLFLWIAAVAIMSAFANWLNVSQLAVAAGEFAVHLLFGFEAAQLRRRSLTRRGYVFADVVSADRRSEAELVFGLRRSEGSVQPDIASPSTQSSRPRPVAASESYGLAPLGGSA